MKTQRYCWLERTLWVLPLSAALLAVCPCPMRAAEDAADLRQKVEDLERKARDLSADGKEAEAREVMRKLDELRAQAGPPGREMGPGPQDQRRREELKQNIDAEREKLRDLLAAGKTDEADQVKKHIEELERLLARPAPPPGFGGPRPGRDRVPEGPGRGMQPGGMSDEQRLRHLQIAIENLHAGGFHEPAERLSQQAEALRQNLQVRQGARPPAVPLEEVERLRAEVQELRRAVRQIRAQMDQLSRERGRR